MIELKDITINDIDEMYKWECDTEIAYLVGIEKCRDFLEYKNTYQDYIDGLKSNLYIRLITINNIVVGRIEFLYHDKTGFIGILIGNKLYHNRGIGTITLMLFLREIKEKYNLSDYQVIAEIYDDNVNSLNFFLKNGFKRLKYYNYEIFNNEERKLLVLEYRL